MPDEHRPEDAPFDGRWFLPDDPETVVAGRLELDGDTWRIVLFGWLGPYDVTASSGPYPTLLHGHVEVNPVTLFDIVPVQALSALGQRPHQTTMSTGTVIFGSHVNASTLCDHASVRLLHLNEWANRRPWSSEDEVDEAAQTWRHKGVYTDPGILEANVPGASVHLVRSMSYADEGLSATWIQSDEFVQFDFATPTDLATIEHDYVRPLKYLVELASGAQSGVVELNLRPQGANRLASNSDVLSAVEPRASGTPKGWWRFLFRLDSVPFDQVMPAWWQLQAQIGPISDLVSSLWDQSLNISNRFLAGATAIEGYHRHRFGGNMTFAQRVDGVVALAGPRFATAIGDAVQWREWVKDGRNSVAHRDPGMVDLEKEWRTAVGVAASMQWLMILVLLSDLSIPDATVEEGLRQNRVLVQLAEYLRTVKPEWFTP